jgi:hypothetical protein
LLAPVLTGQLLMDVILPVLADPSIPDLRSLPGEKTPWSRAFYYDYRDWSRN